MRKFRTIIAWISFAAIVVLLVIIDYNNLVSKANFGLFLGIVVAIGNILSSVLSNLYEKKNPNKP
jgi:uncharacterized membrane protein (DUF485 family)